jgi:peptidyl-prolyl cis-trans isomerase C
MSCGGGACTCGGDSSGGGSQGVAAINGIALHEPGEQVAAEELRERAWSELLRQEAVREGRLPRHVTLDSPGISPGDQAVIQAMLDEAVPLRRPAEDECECYYAAHRQRYARGRAAHVRHILFAVTPGVDVNALARRAEQALLELAHREVAPARFAELAQELSNCPSSVHGGDLGWIAPAECAPEFAGALFDEGEALGLRTRLVHSRFGFHVVDVLARRPGEPVPYADVRERIATELAQCSRATALHQYIRLLAGRALVEGVDLEAASSPLLQ